MAGVATLRRQIGFRTAVALIVGEVIAVGIFLTPSGMAKAVGAPFWLLVIWLVMGGMALCGALCYGELAARFPEAGGGYVYLREAYGRPVAFLYGWMAMLVMDPGLTAALAFGLASYVAYILNLNTRLRSVAFCAILFVAFVNFRGVKLGSWFVRWLTVLKLGLLGFVIVWAFGMQAGSWSNFFPLVSQREGSVPLVAALAGGMVAAFFSFGGWWDLSKVAGEVRDPERNLPRALICGVAILTFVYILTSAAFIYLVPLEAVTTREIFVAQAGEVLFGQMGGQILSGIVIVAVLGSLTAIVMAAPRVYFAMARDGLFIRSAAVLHPRFETPARAIVIQTVLATVLIFVGTFDAIISYFVFVVIIFIGLTVGSLFVFRRRKTDDAPYKTPGYPATPIVFLFFTALILLLIGGNNPKEAALGVAVVLLGLPVYYLLDRRTLNRITGLQDGTIKKAEKDV